MNRFAHDNIDLSITLQRRLAVMTPKVGMLKCPRQPARNPNTKCAKRLELRRHAWTRLPAESNTGSADQKSTTCPGSLNPHK